jgi:hypothetical protein
VTFPRVRWIGSSLLLLQCLACSRDEAELAKIFEARSPRPVGSDTALRQRQRRTPGENPFALPSRPLGAALGDFVLAPSPATLEQAFEHGPEEQTFVYFGAVIEELGPLETRVRFLTHERRTLPNALIVPIRRGALASAGDVLLTSRATGSGLARAIAVGGDPASPRVKYLDPALRAELLPTTELAPSTAALDDTLPRDTFHVVREPGEPGSTLACSTEASVEPAIALKRIDERWLVLGFAGRLRAVAASACRPLPITLPVQVGQKLWFPLLAGFAQGSVQRVDAQGGRVWLKFELAGEAREIGVGVTNLASDLGAPAGGVR